MKVSHLLMHDEEACLVDYSPRAPQDNGDDALIIALCREAGSVLSNLISVYPEVRVVLADEINALGRFIGGTETSSPLILICPREIREASEEYDVPFELGVVTTIYHELGHALYQLDEACFDGKYLASIYPREEDFAEDFAYDLYECHSVNSHVSALCDACEKQAKLK